MKNDNKIVLIVLGSFLILIFVLVLVSNKTQAKAEESGKLIYDTIYYPKEYDYAVRRQTYELRWSYKSVFTLIDEGVPVDTLCFTIDRRDYWRMIGDLYFTKDTIYVAALGKEHTPLTNNKIFFVIPYIQGGSNEYYTYWEIPDGGVGINYWATEKLENIESEVNDNGHHLGILGDGEVSCEKNRQRELAHCQNIAVIPLQL